ncbi:CBS and ACT domain-containing protein [Streptococcus parasalivarius]
MAVKDFMTKRVVYVSPETTVAAAADIMRDKGLRRLPVIEHDKLVGLVTEGTMAEASPSKATSLSIYEMNYLLNKTKVGDIMIKNVLTVSKYASLEDAIYIMLQNKVGVLPVVDNDQISGIITDKDVFRAFLEISGYGQAGIRIGLEVPDTPRVLEKIANLIASENLNIERTIVAPKNGTVLRVELQVEGEIGIEQLKKVFVEAGFTVTEIAETEAKELD